MGEGAERGRVKIGLCNVILYNISVHTYIFM